ncbi:uncharacterized protein LOC129243071 [Anastrepha obliqua]|uniref:uncharacterized protein LOC129243071 n=1 Tax=Anastrepha obliqua TaxID=95512 RepID=UPI00240A8141|nr:uncharacterized protein LOC129243071 [Anastrepha obliqua]
MNRKICCPRMVFTARKIRIISGKTLKQPFSFSHTNIARSCVWLFALEDLMRSHKSDNIVNSTKLKSQNIFRTRHKLHQFSRRCICQTNRVKKHLLSLMLIIIIIIDN